MREPDAGTVRRPLLSCWLQDVLVTLVVLAATLASLRRFGDGFTTVPVLLALAAVAVLPLRRRYPVAVLGVTGVLFGVGAVLGSTTPGATLPLMVAGYGLASRRPRRLAFCAGTGVVTGIVLVSLLVPPSTYFAAPAVPHVLSVALAVVAGDATRSRREVLDALAERARRAEEGREAEARRRVAEERVRIARDLHDTVAHRIAAVNLHAGVAASALPDRPEVAQESLRTIRGSARTVLSEIGALLSVLRSDEPGEQPLGGLANLDALLDGVEGSGLALTRRVGPVPPDLGEPVDRVAYLAVREALTNAQKHGTGRAHLLLERDGDELAVVVLNPLPPEPSSPGGSGFGLLGLRERVESVRGTVSAGPDGEDWRLEVRLPLRGGTL
ncbi:histidine kinase [Pseudonocardia nematodicida]|uniref:histidine kinase n=1 Tax=Pseudonocardia nematodicida TaxID=1206997 RepID=A0ABV1KFN1_9PSEU